MGIITNKPMRFTDKLVPKLGFAVPPATVVSGDTCGEPKPSIKPMLHACGKSTPTRNTPSTSATRNATSKPDATPV